VNDFLWFFSESEVAFVALVGNFACVEGGFYCTVGLVDVRAVAEAALGEMGVEFSEEFGNIFGSYVKEIEFANTGYVPNETAAIECDEFGVGCGVFAFA
jgi:hypothetical protein